MITYRSRHLTAVGVDATRIVRVTRSGEAFASVFELQRAFSELNDHLDALGRKGRRLLIDTREAPSRNDELFERAFAPERARLLSGFERCAVLVRSVGGVLQVQRHARDDDVGARPFTDEALALGWLAE